jgi:hypothetical protein
MIVWTKIPRLLWVKTIQKLVVGAHSRVDFMKYLDLSSITDAGSMVYSIVCVLTIIDLDEFLLMGLIYQFHSTAHAKQKHCSSCLLLALYDCLHMVWW